MTTVTLEEAQANLAGLIAELKPGQEIRITEKGRLVARLLAEPPSEANLAGLIAELKPGQEIRITEKGRLVARLLAEPSSARRPRQPGSAIGKLTIVEDDDAHLRDFEEYMP